MSFVGTRPEAVKYVEKYKPEYMATWKPWHILLGMTILIFGLLALRNNFKIVVKIDSFAAWLSHQTDVYAWTMSGKRHDIGDRASYDAVQEIMKNQA